MTDNILAAIVAEQVDRAMTNGMGTITKGLAAGISPEDHVDQITVELIVKSMRLTAQMSTQLTIRLLEAFGCIELPPDGAPLILSDDKENQ